MFDHNLYITYNILCYVYIIKYHDINEIILIKLLYFITIYKLNTLSSQVESIIL